MRAASSGDSKASVPFRYRLALAAFLVSAFLFFASARCLYATFRRFCRDLALAFPLLNAISVAVQCAAALPLIAATGLDCRNALIAIETHKAGFVAAQLFFGTWLFPPGYLAMKSRLIPRAIGKLLLADGIGVLVWFLQAFSFPNIQRSFTPTLP